MNRIHLSAEEVEMANMMGVPLLEYGKQKARLQQELKEYEAWLQTPAGVTHMEKLQRRREKRLAYLREYNRKYRAKKREERLASKKV